MEKEENIEDLSLRRVGKFPKLGLIKKVFAWENDIRAAIYAARHDRPRGEKLIGGGKYGGSPTENQAIATLIAALLHTAHHFGIKGVTTGGQQHTDGVGLINFQTACQRRRGIVEMTYRLLNFFAHAITDKAIVIDHVRDS